MDTIPLPDRIDTARLILRPPVHEDARGLFEEYAQDAEVTRFLVWRPHTDLAQTREFIESCLQTWQSGPRRPYVIVLRDDPLRPAGMLEGRWLGHSIDIGYVLARRHWGRGLMPEAVSAFVDIALALPGVFRVQAACDAENVASARTLEKAGFAREGRLERFGIHPNMGARPRACLMYARVR